MGEGDVEKIKIPHCSVSHRGPVTQDTAVVGMKSLREDPATAGPKAGASNASPITRCLNIFSGWHKLTPSCLLVTRKLSFNVSISVGAFYRPI